jgi:hypothetical protein
MIDEKSRQRVRRHAGLLSSYLDPTPSIAEILSRSDQIAMGELKHSLADLVAILTEVNVQLNGPVPSETIGGPSDDRLIQVDVVYAVSEIVRMFGDCAASVADERLSGSLEHAGVLIEEAWLGVLAGDVDDLEAWARLQADLRMESEEDDPE